MESNHAYTVKAADDLFASLQEAQDFLIRDRKGTWNPQGRKNPWLATNESRERIEDEFTREVSDSRNFQVKGLESPSTFEKHLGGEALLNELKNAAKTDVDVSVYRSQLEAMLAEHDGAISPVDLSRDNSALINDFFAQEFTLLRAVIIAEAQKTKINYDEGFRSMALNNILNYGIVKSLREKIYKAQYDRRIAVAEAKKKQALRSVKKPSPADLRRENFRFTPAEVETLRAVIDQCRNYFVKVNGIKPEHAPYVESSDLTLEDFKLALAAAPSALRDIAFKALRSLQRLELLEVLLEVHCINELNERSERKSYYLLDEKIPPLLSGVGVVRDSSFIENRRVSLPSKGLRVDTTDKRPVRVLMSGSDLVLKAADSRPPEQGALLYDMNLTIKPPFTNELLGLKYLACRGHIEGQSIKESKLLGFQGHLSNCTIDSSKIHGFNGRIEGSVFKSCKLDAAAGHLAEAGIMMDCKVKVGTGARFKGVAFYESKIKLTAEEGEAVFEMCDFSGLRMTDEELVQIARHSVRCEFSDAQLKVLKKTDVNSEAIDPRSATKSLNHLDTILAEANGKPYEITDWRPLVQEGGETAMEVDMLDPERALLKGVPPSEVLSKAGLDKDFDPRRIAHPLNRKGIAHLPERVRAYQALADFVRTNKAAEKIPLTSWLDFFKSLGTELASSCFGISPALLEFEGSYWDALPVRKPLALRSKKGVVEAFYEDEVGLKSLKGKIAATSEWDSSEKLTLSRFTKHQWVKRKLLQYLVNLRRFGSYLEDLTKMGYVYPELDETASGFELEGLVHPDVHRDLGEKAQANDVSLPAAEGGSVVNISSAQNNDGKSTLQAAIALALSQAQSGLPVPARRARLNPHAAFDSIMVMPNTRADAGQGAGVMKERVQMYAELRARLTAKTGGDSRVLVLMDEISMGATNAKQAATFDTNTVLEVAQGIQGITSTVIAIVQDAEEIVSRWQTALGSENVVLLTHTTDQAPHQFTRAEKAVSSKPDAVLEEFGLAHLMSDSGWKTTT